MDNEKIVSLFKDFDLSLNDEKLNNIRDLVHKTLETNKLFNLTAIKEEDEFYEKMVLDSALGLKDIDLTNKKVIDVGTGAGFPGMVLYILNPQMDITLLDSTEKKIKYLEGYAKEKNYHMSFSSMRMEDYAQKNRNIFDYAYARAVSSLNILLELIMPVLKVGGTFVALKGPTVDNEIKEANNAFKVLGCKVVDIKKYVLPISKEERNIVLIKKEKETSSKHPRQYAQIKRRPL